MHYRAGTKSPKPAQLNGRDEGEVAVQNALVTGHRQMARRYAVPEEEKQIGGRTPDYHICRGLITSRHSDLVTLEPRGPALACAVCDPLIGLSLAACDRSYRSLIWRHHLEGVPDSIRGQVRSDRFRNAYGPLSVPPVQRGLNRHHPQVMCYRLV